MSEYEKKEYRSVILAALLHDIGKFLHRKDDATYNEKGGHPKASAMFVTNHYETLKNDRFYSLDLVRFLTQYHGDDNKQEVLKDPYFNEQRIDKERTWDLLKVVKNADIYSCAEREHPDPTRFAKRSEPLNSIFQNINLSQTNPPEVGPFNYHLNVLDPSKCFPDNFADLDEGEFEDLIELFQRKLPDFSKFDKFEDIINKWLDILHYYTCNVPSDTRYDRPDVSLYDHSRSSAAFAACLYKRHLESIRNNTQFKRPNEFILVGGDYSGIQDYIYHITNRGSGGASKRLRARSFFVSLFSEATIHKILDALDLPLFCNLFSAGGKFLLLAPNIEGITETLQRVKAEIDSEINRTYFNQFSFLLSWMEIHGYTKNKEKPSEFKIYTFYKSADDMFHLLETEKLKKFKSIFMNDECNGWNPDNFKGSKLYEQYTKTGDCKICGRGPGTEIDVHPETKEVTICCPICYRDKYTIGKDLPTAKYIAFGKGVIDRDDRSGKMVLFGPGESDESAAQGSYYAEFLQTPREIATDHYLVYALSSGNGDDPNVSRPILKKYYANYVPIEDNRILSFEEISEKSLWTNGDKDYGSKLLGVLKVDIDNLGLIFSRGFEKPRNPETDSDGFDRKTVSRFLTLSRMTDLFFSGWIKDIMNADKESVIQQLLKIKDIDRSRFEEYLKSASIDFKNIYTVYSGGDDLVLIGPWETMIVFAIHMNVQFRKYTCKNEDITLSAGLAFVKDKYPVAWAIKEADELLEKAKMAGKNAISLFHTTVEWKRLPEFVNFFLFLDGEINKPDPEINTAFLYRLLEYHRMAMRFIEDKSKNIEGLKYVSALSYDIGRNIVKRDKEGNITKGYQISSYLQTMLIDNKPRDKSSLIYKLKPPLFWCLYRNRRFQATKEVV